MWVYDWGAQPGVRVELDTIENQFAWGRRELSVIWGTNPIDGAARDAGASPTTLLRPGLCLGLITATKKYKQYDPAASDGSEIFRAILMSSYKMVDISGANQDKMVPLCVAGPVKAGKLIGLDALARSQSMGRFLFDDEFATNSPYVLPAVALDFSRTRAVTSNTTVQASDNGTHFFANGGAAITFTLPPPARGYQFRFTDVVNFNMTVTGAAANQLITFNNAAATSVSFSTAGNLIGGTIDIVSNFDGTKWVVLPSGPNTLTVA